MCLVIDEAKTKKLLSRMKKKGYMTCWKVLFEDEEDGSLFSPFFRYFTWKRGIVRSNRKSSKLERMEKLNDIVSTGIHVFTNSKDAKTYMTGGKIYPVKCYAKDLVAAGYPAYREKSYAAVFTKVVFPGKSKGKRK